MPSPFGRDDPDVPAALADLVLDARQVLESPSDVSLAPWTKKSVPTGVLGAGAAFAGVMAGMVCRAAPPRSVGDRVTNLPRAAPAV